MKCRNQCLDSPIEHAACRDDVSIGVWYVKKSTTWLSNISEIILTFLLTVVDAMTSQVQPLLLSPDPALPNIIRVLVSA